MVDKRQAMGLGMLAILLVNDLGSIQSRFFMIECGNP